MKPAVDFFFFYGSIYTYLAVMRVEQLAASAGVQVRWRPFNLRAILIEQNNTGFVRNAVRMKYSWRDVERRAARHGIEYAGQPPYPVDPELLALRIGTIAATDGWCPEYTKATYRSWFIDKKVPGNEANVGEILGSLHKPAGEIMARAASGEVAKKLEDETDAARALGVFGSPTFAIGTEIFWGDDRLEEAIELASRG